MRFSDRIGITKPKAALQLDRMDQDLRVGLWNVFQVFFLDRISHAYLPDDVLDAFFATLWIHFLKRPLDSRPAYAGDVHRQVREWFFKAEWFEVYNLLEFAAQTRSPVNATEFTEACNGMMEAELSGYRLVGKQIVPITNPSELKAIEDALEAARGGQLKGVWQHLNAALAYLGDKKDPDYRNSIKESLSAVEAVAKLISGQPKAGLGDALKVIEKTHGLHGALRAGFSSIYGYGSDADGIRHATIDLSKCDVHDAKFMLVACSAFVNYLLAKGQKAGVEF